MKVALIAGILVGENLINFLREQTFKNLAQIETYLNI